MQGRLSENDFQNPAARKLFNILAACYENQTVTLNDILIRCDDETMVRLITESLSTGVYRKEDVSVIVNDTINYVMRNRLEDQRNKLLLRIKNYNVVTEDDQKQLTALLAEKMELDKQVLNLGK